MAKSRPSHRSSKSRPSKPDSLLHSTQVPRRSKPQASPSPTVLLAEASNHLIQSNPDLALPLAQRALSLLQPPSTAPTAAALPALNLLAQINLEVGDADAAREFFVQSAALDPEGRIPEASGGGVEKFLWLAQLSEEGGRESVEWFERGCAVLRQEISALESSLNAKKGDVAVTKEVEERRRKLSGALCGIVEIWMTDLSFEDEAEGECERLMTEALLVAPQSSEALQTLASVRISQVRVEEARGALGRSMEMWAELLPEDERVPDFATRISLARLLMEVEMLDEAVGVLERLVGEDDESVEAWYLGGWCLFLLGEKGRQAEEGSYGREDAEGGLSEWQLVMGSSREWLRNSLRLYDALDYEDDRLRDHALELVEVLEGQLGPLDEADGVDEDLAEGDSGWEDNENEGGDGDQEMAGL